MRIIILFLVFSILLSCKENELKVNKYNDSNILLKTSLYHSQEDTIPYKTISYFIDGNIESINFFDKSGRKNGECYENDKDKKIEKWTEYRKGEKHGKVNAKFYDGRHIIQPYRNGVVEGIEYHFDSLGVLQKEMWWIDGSPVIEEKIFHFSKGDTLFTGMQYEGINKDSSYIAASEVKVHTYAKIEISDNTIIGREYIGWLYCSEGKVDKGCVFNSYHYISMPDTIYKNDTLKVNLSYYQINFDKDSYLIVDIGRLDKELNVEIPYRSLTVEKGVSQFSFDYKDYSEGYNVLMGRVSVMKGDRVINQSIIFEDFYVLPAP